MIPRFLRSFVFSLLLLGAGLVHAADWWDATWPIRKSITLDPATVPGFSGDAVSSPTVLVRLHEGVFNFAAAKPDLSDVRFVAEDGKTVLPYHVEKIDPLMNEAFLWVKLPEVAPGKPVKFWLYYGNLTDKAVNVQNEKASWSDAFAAVYHFSDTGDSVADASGHDRVLTGGVARAEGGQIGGALRFDGRSTAAVNDGAVLALSPGASLTFGAWVKSTGEGPRALAGWSSGRTFFSLGLDGGAPYVETNTSTRKRGSSGVTSGAWHHVAYVISRDLVRFYVDGEVMGSADVTVPSLSAAPVLGGDGRGANTQFVGEVDEAFFATGPFSSGALRLMAATQGANGATVVVVGPDEIPQGFFHFLKEGYVGVIISSLTFDAWLVIVICFFMAIISWMVMVKKARWLNRIVKGNEVFLKLWHEVSNDLSVIDSEDVSDAQTMGGRITPEQGKIMRESSLYQVYHVGVEEIRHRITASSGGAPVIKARSIHAIKAMLEGSMIRQTQKLNANMVLLTIAISGGPFLGLLGTVVGVMITFAAVAQAGEVNVNAIAPGIAAALAATCAGLGVAIPALFGYNYLLTRIKATTTDMTVFIDEFVTKLAEFYGGEGDHE